MERILGGGTLVGGSVLKSIAEAGLGGPVAPAEAALGGPTAEGGGGTLEALIPGEAVWARGGGGGGCAAFAAASPPAYRILCKHHKLKKSSRYEHLLVHPSFEVLVIVESALFTEISLDRSRTFAAPEPSAKP